MTREGILIELRGIKREINGDFTLCGDRGTLRFIAQQILKATSEDFSYGWIDVRMKGVPAKGNNPPIAWEEQG